MTISRRVRFPLLAVALLGSFLVLLQRCAPLRSAALFAVLTFLPLVLFAFFLLRALPRLQRAAVLGLGLLAAIFLFARPHAELFTGLDNSAYRLAAEAFLDGRPLHSPDPVLATVPPAHRRTFLFTRGREPTRDTVFRLANDYANTDAPLTRPWFTPTLSLLAYAAARNGLPLTAPPALVGALLVCLLLAAAARRGGWPLLLCATAFLLATPIPAFFFRGFYADALGAALVASAIAYALSAQPLLARPGSPPLPRLRLLLGFVLLFSLAFHRSAALLGALVLFLLVTAEGRLRTAVAYYLGAMLGALPALWVILFVAQPYGPTLLSRTHATFVAGIPVLLVSLLLLSTLLGLPAIRRRLAARPAHVHLAAALLAILCWCLLPAACPATMHLVQGHRRALAAIPATFDGVLLGLLFCTLVFAIVRVVRMGKRTLSCPRVPLASDLLPLALLGATAFSAVAAWHLLGRETPAGIWSYRRLLVPFLALCAILPATLDALLRAVSPSQHPTALVHQQPRIRRLICPILLALLLLPTPFLHPYPYIARITPEAPTFARDLDRAIRPATRPAVLFDYFADAIPLAVHPRNHVLALRPWAYPAWAHAWDWLLTQAPDTPEAPSDPSPPLPATLATSHAPVVYEQNAFLASVTNLHATLTGPSSKGFLHAMPDARPCAITLLALTPCRTQADLARLVNASALHPAPGGVPPPPQHKTFDGGPAALRGPWGPHIPRRHGQWARQHAALLGPLPAPGEAATITLRASWFAPDRPQPVTITAPWGATTTLVATSPDQELVFILPSGSDDIAPATSPAIAPYVLTTPTPSDPALAGFPSDLVLFLHEATIAIPPLPRPR
ncbi:MAG: hypothetical protein IJT88_09095 [Kiritimatiellae bacterium]|nr:hypothetical protein [Kiritimatiellia bacterium]